MIGLLGIFLLTFTICLIFSKEINKKIRVILYAFKLPGPFGLPPFGCGHRFLCKKEDIFDRIIKIFTEYPQSMIRVWLGHKFFIVLREPEHIEKVLHSTKIAQKDSLMDLMKPFVGNGILTGNGPVWRAHRKVIAPTLNNKVMENFCSVFEKQSTILLDKIAQNIKQTKNPIVDIEEFMHPCCIDMVCETVMDIELNAQSFIEQDFIKAYEGMYHIVIERMSKPWLQSDFIFFFTPLAREQKKIVKILRDFIRNSIHKKQNDRSERIMDELVNRLTNDGPGLCRKMQEIAKSKKGEGDSRGEIKEVQYEEPDTSKKIKTSLDQLVELMDGGNFDITEEELIDEMLTLFAASSDTIASIASFAISMLAMHPEIQEKALEEVRIVKNKYGESVTLAACGELQYVDRCIKETIRLFPIGPFLVRYAQEDFRLSESEVLPEGSSVFISNFTVHRDPRFWEKPQEFHPDHHLPEQTLNRPVGAFNPFSAGIRNCVGKLFAMVSIKIIIAEFLSRYELQWKGPQVSVKDLPLFSDISIRSKCGHKVLLKPRDY